MKFRARNGGRTLLGTGEAERSGVPGGLGVTTTNGDQPPGDGFREAESGTVRELSIVSDSGTLFRLLFCTTTVVVVVGEGGDGERVSGYEMGGCFDCGEEEDDAEDVVVHLEKKECPVLVLPWLSLLSLLAKLIWPRRRAAEVELNT